jgi:hypothetical protein
VFLPKASLSEVTPASPIKLPEDRKGKSKDEKSTITTSATSTNETLAFNSNKKNNNENHNNLAQNPPKTCARPQKKTKKLATHSPDRTSDVKVVFLPSASLSEVTPSSCISRTSDVKVVFLPSASQSEVAPESRRRLSDKLQKIK